MIYPDLPHDVNSPTHPVSAMDYMPVEPLRALQLHRLQWTVKYAYERVPLFCKRCEERGVRPEHIKTLAAIRNVPFTPTPLNADFTWNGRIAGRPALFLLTNPNAPTGVLTAPETVAAAELFEALRRKNIFVRYFKGPRTGDRLRMTIGTDAEMDTLLAALATLDRA